MLDQLKVGFIAGRVQRDGTGIVDRAAQGQHGPVADRHRAGIVERRRLIEHEVSIR